MRSLGIFLAVIFHVAILLFGGIFLLNENEKKARAEELMDVEPVAEEAKKTEEPKPEEKKEEKKDEDPPEEPPQFQNAAPTDQPPGPALAPLSLSDLDSLLGGAGGDGAFGGGGGLSSGGVIGGAGGVGGDGSGMLSASQLDQKPRILVRVDPKPPAALAKTLPQVNVTVFIDSSGNVMRAELTPVVDGSSQKAIMDAVLRWKYEPGQRGGQKVSCKVSHKISFQ